MDAIKLVALYECAKKTTRLKTLYSFLLHSEGKIERVEETATGFVAAISIPDVQNSAAIYVYDSVSNFILMVSVDEREDDLNRAEVDALVPRVVAMLNPKEPTPRPHRRSRHARRRKTDAIADRNTFVPVHHGLAIAA